MKCPLSIMADFGTPPTYETNIIECLGAEYAWWVDATGSCAIPQLPLVMSGLADIVEQLVLQGIRPRAVFTCNDCGVRVFLEADAELKTPYDWQRQERVDGTLAWVCPQCMEGRK